MSENELLYCPQCRSIYRSQVSWCAADGCRLDSGPDPLLGEIVADRYRLVELVGEGAMGRVYRAEHVHLARPFAVKVLYGELASDRMMRMRFAREARAASLLSHRNLVTVTDFGAAESGLLYLVMEYVAGESLATYAHRRHPLPHRQVIDIVRQICDGLGYVHSRGLVHRDLKPDNVIVVKDGQDRPVPRILDFGLAISEIDPGDARCTEKGMVCGTPCYMAPEHALDHDVDHRADLFSLGVIVYELLTGKTPFDGGSYDVAMLNATATPPSFSERAPDVTVPADLEALVFRLLEKEPERRFQSAAEVAVALERCTFAVECDGRATNQIPALPQAAALAAAERGVASGSGAFSVRPAASPSPSPAPRPQRAQIASPPTDEVLALVKPRRRLRAVPMLALAGLAFGAWSYGEELTALVWSHSGADTAVAASDSALDLDHDSAELAVAATVPAEVPVGRGGDTALVDVADPAPSAADAMMADELDDEALPDAEVLAYVDAVAAVDDSAGDDDRVAAAKADRNQVRRRARERRRRLVERRAAAKAERAAATAPRSVRRVEPSDSESLNEITRLYTRVGVELAALERSDPSTAAALRKQLFDIPYSDALRIPALRDDSIAALRTLRGEIRSALRPAEPTRQTAKLP